MLAEISEGSGHAAASGVQIHYRRRWDALQERYRGRQQAHRLLVAMTVEQNPSRPSAQPEIELRGEFVEKLARICHDLGLMLVIAAQQ